MWNQGKHLQLIDSSLENSCNPSEVMRCIHIGMLCVQQYPEDRPTMLLVVQSLGSENILPQPKLPSFLMDNKSNEQPDPSSNKPQSTSTNEITISELEPR